MLADTGTMACDKTAGRVRRAIVRTVGMILASLWFEGTLLTVDNFPRIVTIYSKNDPRVQLNTTEHDYNYLQIYIEIREYLVSKKSRPEYHFSSTLPRAILNLEYADKGQRVFSDSLFTIERVRARSTRNLVVYVRSSYLLTAITDSKPVTIGKSPNSSSQTIAGYKNNKAKTRNSRPEY